MGTQTRESWKEQENRQEPNKSGMVLPQEQRTVAPPAPRIIVEEAGAYAVKAIGNRGKGVNKETASGE